MKKFLNFISNIKFLIENKSLPGSLVVVCRSNRKRRIFLLIKSLHSNAVTFPSGNLNPFEDFYEAAIRELHEETGLRVKKTELILTPLIHKFKYKNLPIQIKSQQRIFLVLLKTDSKILDPQDNDVVWARWCDLNKTLSLLSYPELKATLKKAIKYLKIYEYE